MKNQARMTERLLAVQWLYGTGLDAESHIENINEGLAGLKTMLKDSLLEGGDSENNLDEVLQSVKDENIMDLIRQYQQHKNTIKDIIHQSLEGGQQRFAGLDKLLQIILSLGVGELLAKKLSPAVVIVAWVGVAQSYFSDQAPKLIHAVLDKAKNMMGADTRDEEK